LFVSINFDLFLIIGSILNLSRM